MIKEIIAKVCHDLISPINGLGLFVECVEDQIPDECLVEINGFMKSFSATVEIFRTISMSDDSEIEIKKLESIIKDHANTKNISIALKISDEVSFGGNGIKISGKFATTLVFMYIIAARLIMKNGRVNFNVTNNEIFMNVHAQNHINKIDFSNIKDDDSKNILVKYGIQEIKRLFALDEIEFEECSASEENLIIRF